MGLLVLSAWACVLLFFVFSSIRTKMYIAIAVLIAFLLGTIGASTGSFALSFMGDIIIMSIGAAFLVSRATPPVSRR